MVRVDVISLGDIAMDVIISVPKFPQRGGDVHSESMDEIIGGCATNTAVTLHKFNHNVGLIGAIGDDHYGNIILEYLKKEGLETSHIQIVSDDRTTTCFIILDEERERTFITFGGAQYHLSLDNIDETFIANAKCLYISGYILLGSPSRETAIYAAKIAKENGVKVFFDPALHPASLGMNFVLPVLEQTDVLLLNSIELEKIITPSRKSIEDLFEIGPKLIVVKRGKKGCRIFSPREQIEVGGFEVEVIDTTGAGDGFNAGFIHSILEGWDIEKSAIFANAVGALTVAVLGARPEITSEDDVIKFMMEKKRNL